MKTKNISTIVAALAAAFITTAAFAHEGEDHAKGGRSVVPKVYPLKKCPVSDDGFDHGKPVKVTTPDGTDVWLCCKDCVREFKKNPEKYGKMVKDAKAKK